MLLTTMLCCFPVENDCDSSLGVYDDNLLLTKYFYLRSLRSVQERKFRSKLHLEITGRWKIFR